MIESRTPRAQFCWECGLQLRQRKMHVEIVVDGHSRILHKSCADDVKRGERQEFISKAELHEDSEE